MPTISDSWNFGTWLGSHVLEFQGLRKPDNLESAPANNKPKHKTYHCNFIMSSCEVLELSKTDLERTR